MQGLKEIRQRLVDKEDRDFLVGLYSGNNTFEDAIKPKLGHWVEDIENVLCNDKKQLSSNWLREKLEDGVSNNFGFLAKLIDEELNKFTRHPFYISRISPQENEFALGIVLYQSEYIQISLTILDEHLIRYRKKRNESTKTGFFINAGTTVFYCLKGGARIGRFALDEPFCEESELKKYFDGDYSEFDVSEKSSFCIEGRKEGITFLSCKGSACFIVVQVIKGSASTRLQYCTDTNNLLAVVSNDQVASRFQVATVALRQLAGDDYSSVLIQYLYNSNPYVRWHSAREIFLANKEKGRNAFSILKNDKHPMVKRAAIRCLFEYFGEDKCL